ncbi:MULTISPECIES: LexA family protein [Marinomonas]|uniref:Helix-turn-helix domain-containing protein n=1 Tax=Marinomonas rhodophyticola TaxID=2992803 RepID=A0ABT3KGE6_9GAMM|nr:S24 family peptidase [Marinomonas sp. KJ51-3]MCW4629621.1 helix-turn-helix domain-containing protein [Marinomonas sp. KJ51-3]
MKTLGLRIRQKRNEQNITQLQLSKLVGVSHVTVSQWESDTTAPKGENLYKLAQILKTQANWLISGIDSQHESNVVVAPLAPKTKKLPVISHVQAGAWTEAIDYMALGDDIQWEEAPSSVEENAFWLKVIGDSMTAQSGISVPEGSLILVNPNIPAENGSLVVAKLDGTDEVTFKKLVIDAGQKYLKPLNQSYNPLQINGNCRIVGVVTESKYKF